MEDSWALLASRSLAGSENSRLSEMLSQIKQGREQQRRYLTQSSGIHRYMHTHPYENIQIHDTHTHTKLISICREFSNSVVIIEIKIKA